MRMRKCIPPVAPTVHVYNALIAACDREGMWDKALELHKEMHRENVKPNQVSLGLCASMTQVHVSLIMSNQ